MDKVSNIRSNGGAPIAHESARVVRRKVSTTALDLLAERDRNLPVWIRSPKCGPEHYTGFSRAKLYVLAGEGKVRSVSIREPGQVKGTRLFHLASIISFIESCEKTADASKGGEAC